MKNTMIFEAYEKNAVGVWFFTPDYGRFDPNLPMSGFGAVRYLEGSVYTGQLYYDGKTFHKLGRGQQDFSHSRIGALLPELGEKKYKFVGHYDYRRTDWIFGNGVLYYTDGEGRPTHFVKGFFEGLRKTGDYRGMFNERTLLYGYTPEMEFDGDESISLEKCLAVRVERARCSVDTKTLLIGDSYFDLGDNKAYAGDYCFQKTLPAGVVNIGIGGSTFRDWLSWIDRFRGTAVPERIVLNLGFNDLHGGRPVHRVYSDYRKMLQKLHDCFPGIRIFLIATVHAPAYVHLRAEEDEFNAEIHRTAERLGVTILDWNDRLAAGGNVFHIDKIHPNEAGYALLTSYLSEILQERS